jgi:hypothetical protein
VLALCRPNDIFILVKLDLVQVNLPQMHDVDRPVQRHFLPVAGGGRRVLHIQSTFDEARLTSVLLAHHAESYFGETGFSGFL